MNKIEISKGTDKYFTCTRNTVEKFGDVIVKYGVFLRQDVVIALKPAIDFIKQQCPTAIVTQMYPEGTLVRSEQKILTIEGPFSQLVELETHILQRIGVAQITAFNAYKMAKALPLVPFMDMAARHLTGPEQHDLAAYGASVGSKAAQLEGATGFIGSSTDLTAQYYGAEAGMGTTPHAAVGYAAYCLKKEGYSADSVVKNATAHSVIQFIQANPTAKTVIALVDYYGNEISDGVSCADVFHRYSLANPELMVGKKFGVRLDTHGGRFLQSLNYNTSVEIVEKWLNVSGEFNIVRKVLGDTSFDLDTDNRLKDQARKVLFGQGVSAAAIIAMRQALDRNSFKEALIVASSGFNLSKCLIMASVNAPINMVGTGSFLPETYKETYATADIYMYGDDQQVKVGREWLFD